MDMNKLLSALDIAIMSVGPWNTNDPISAFPMFSWGIEAQENQMTSKVMLQSQYNHLEAKAADLKTHYLSTIKSYLRIN